MPLKYDPQLKQLVYDPTSALSGTSRLSRDAWLELLPKVEAVRVHLLANPDWHDWPDRMLAEYRSLRRPSPLFNILGTARRIRDAVDCVVVLGSTAVCQAGRAVFGACCHPYHNELSSGDRGGKPRLYFVEDQLDNDALQGVCDLLMRRSTPHGSLERFAIIAVRPAAQQATSESFEIILRILIQWLRHSLAGHSEVMPEAEFDEHLGQYVVMIDPPTMSLAQTKPEPRHDCSPASRSSHEQLNVFTEGVLLPASIVGVDIVRLLEGGRAMNEAFRMRPPGENPALDFATIEHLAHNAGLGSRVRWWNSALEATQAWHQLLQPQARHKTGQGADTDNALPLVTNVIAHAVRRDRIMVAQGSPDAIAGVPNLASESNPVPLPSSSSSSTLPVLMSQQILRANQTCRDRGQPTADIHLPGLDEASMGQLFQMLMLADALARQMNDG